LEKAPSKTWKLFSMFSLVFVLLGYVLLISAISQNTNGNELRQNAIEVTDSSALTPASFNSSLLSTILLKPDTSLYQNKLHLILAKNNNSILIIPFYELVIQSILSIIIPLFCLLIISISAFVCSAFYHAKRIENKLIPICNKADLIIKNYDSTYNNNINTRPILYLEQALQSLQKLAKDYQIHVEQSVVCDKLTKLVDRHTFLEHINKQIDITAAKNKKSGLLFIDLDGFKQVNDSFGHSFGDEILIQVAERLTSIVRRQGLNFKSDEKELEYNLARLGGDEFTVFIQELDKSERAVNVAKHVLQELERDFVLGNKTIKISASVGIAVYPDSASTPNALVQMADVAMYRAKTDGRGIYRIYSPEMGSKMRRYHYLLDEMKLAIDSDSFFLTFQPIIHVDGSTISYFEALVRWQHPVEGTITPAEFIPIAEDSNLILDLGDWILDEACRQMAAWYNAGMNKARISVNVSGIQLKHRPIYQWVMAAINKIGLPASSLMLEITESCFIEAADDIITELEKLRAEGIMIAIDDFGTGFSSLSMLANLPVDVLKIDRLFISEAMTNKKYHKILRSIVDMAGDLELKVVAEGIEHVEQLELLKSLGVVYIQGYLISRPQRSSYVGKKVLDNNHAHMAQMGTTTWPPQPSRVVGLIN